MVFMYSCCRSRSGDEGRAESAALAAVGKGETTQGLAVLGAKRGHRWLQILCWK
jgi:hypothetical protein